MKITIVRSAFLDALKQVQNVVGSKVAQLVLQNVMLKAAGGKVELTTTDLDLSVCCSAACQVEVEGETTLPVKLLFNTVSRLVEGPVVIEVSADDRARISAGSATFRLSGRPAAEFPPLPADSDAYAYVIPQITLREMIRKTAYAASQDDTRKTLRGVLMSFKNGKLTMVATDGRRLALVEHEMEFPADAERDVVLPSKLVSELLRSLSSDGEVKVTVEKSQISFSFGASRIYSKLFDEVYPNYRQVIPQSFSEHVTIERQLFIDALGRASVMMNEDASSMRLIFDSNQLTVISNAADRGEARDQIAIKYSGPRIEASFNPAYILDPLKAIDDDEIIIDLNSGSTPAMMRCSVPFLYVMMPLRVN